MSIVLQYQSCSDDDKLKQVLLPLAERKITMHKQQGKMDQEQETHLYLMVLEMQVGQDNEKLVIQTSKTTVDRHFQHKYKEALDILDEPLGEKLALNTAFINFVENKRLAYMKKLSMWAKVNILSKQMLKIR